MLPIGKVLLVLALIAGIGLVWMAQADAATPAELVTMEAAAAQTFPNSPCEGRVVLLPVSMDELKAITGWSPPTPEPGGAAVQDNADGTCKVFELATLLADDPYGACKVYVHEYGHLAGAHHGDPLMGENGDHFAPCLLVIPTVTSARAVQVLRERRDVEGFKVKCWGGTSDTGAYCVLRKRVHGRLIRRVYGVDLYRLGETETIIRLNS